MTALSEGTDEMLLALEMGESETKNSCGLVSKPLEMLRCRKRKQIRQGNLGSCHGFILSVRLSYCNPLGVTQSFLTHY